MNVLSTNWCVYGSETLDLLDRDTMSNEELNLCKMMLLSICYSSNIGGIATLTGTPTNIIAIGMIERRVLNLNKVLLFQGYFQNIRTQYWYHIRYVDGIRSPINSTESWFCLDTFIIIFLWFQVSCVKNC